MTTLGFESLGAFLLFVTSLLCGITMVMGVNAVNSAPSFMLDYYKYLHNDPNATPKHPTFWGKVLTFYTIVTIVAQSLHEPTNVTQFLCRFSLLFRMEVSTLLMLVELLIIVIMPHTGTSEVSAMVGLMVAAYLGGAGRAYFENTGYALLGPCPSKYLAGLLIGSALCGALVSIVQLVLLGTLSTDYHSVLVESIFYFTISIIIITISALCIIAMLKNTFAQHYIAEFRSSKSVWENIYTPYEKTVPSDDRSEADNDEPASDANAYSEEEKGGEEEEEMNKDVIANNSNRNSGKQDERDETKKCQEREANDVISDNEHSAYYLHDVGLVRTSKNKDNDNIENIYIEFTEHYDQDKDRCNECNKREEPLDTCAQVDRILSTEFLQNNVCITNQRVKSEQDETTSALLQSAQLWKVVRLIWPMMLSELAVFGITYIMYPGVLVAVDPDNVWFTTIMMAVYNFGDFFGRMATMIKAFWPSRRVVVIGSCLRVVFIPLLILCAKGIIPTQAAGYVLTAILAITNGFFGTLTMVYTPLTPGLTTDGERALAGQCTGVCLLIGCSVGSLLQLAIVIPL